MAPTLSAEVLTRLIKNGALNGAAVDIRQEVACRQHVATEVLGGFRTRRHPNAFHLWLRSHEGWTEADFVSAAEQRGIGVTLGSLFEVGRTVEDVAVRIYLSGASSVDILARGLRIVRGRRSDLLPIDSQHGGYACAPTLKSHHFWLRSYPLSSRHKAACGLA